MLRLLIVGVLAAASGINPDETKPRIDDPFAVARISPLSVGSDGLQATLAASTRIVHGKVASAISRSTLVGASQKIVTDYQISVTDALPLGTSKSSVTVTLAGGCSGRTCLQVTDHPNFGVGEEVVFILTDSTQASSPLLLGWFVLSGGSAITLGGTVPFAMLWKALGG